MKKITLIEKQKTTNTTKTSDISKPGTIMPATTDVQYKIMVDGVELTPKNATFAKKKGRIVVEKDGEVVVELDYGSEFEVVPAELEVADGWVALNPEPTEAGILAVPALLWGGLGAAGAAGAAAVIDSNSNDDGSGLPPGPTIGTLGDPDDNGKINANGTTDPGSTVTVTWPDGTTSTVTAGTDGTWSVESATVQTSGTVSATAKNVDGSTTAATTATYTDSTPPAVPTVKVADPDGNGKINASGTAEPGSTVTLTWPDGSTTTTTTNADGTWSVESPKVQTSGTVTATAKDAAGNTSTAAGTTYTDTTPPAAPTITAADTDNDGKIDAIGTAEPGSTVTLTWPDGTTSTATVGNDGTWSTESATIQPSGTVKAIAKDAAGNTSTAAIATYNNSTPPAAPTLTVKDADGDNKIDASGTAEPGSTITVTWPDGTTSTTTTGNNGTWSTESPTVQTSGTVRATARDAAGNTSTATGASYTDTTPPVAPTVTVGDGDSDGKVNASGTAEAGSTITITWPDGSTSTTTTANNGTWSTESPTVQTSGKVSVTAKDAAGNTSTATDVTYTDTTPPVAPTITVGDSDKDGRIDASGTSEPGSTITITWPDGTTSKTTAGADGNWSTESLTVQASGIVSAKAQDAAGNTSNATSAPYTAAPGYLAVAIPEAADGINAAEAADGIVINVSLPGGATAGDLITASLDGGTPVTHTVTTAEVSAGAASLTLSAAALTAAGQGGATLTTTYVDASGIPAANSPVITSLTIDTVAPGNLTVAIPEAAGGISAAEAADGVAVNVSLPSGAAAGDLITVSIDGSTPVTHTVTAAEVSAGSASLTLSPAALAAAGQGAATVTTTYTDASGNPATNSPVATSLTIDTAGPGNLTVTIPEAADGISAAEAADGVAVNVSLPSGAAAGDLITVSIDGGTPVTHTVTAAEVSARSASLTLSAAALAAAGQGAATVTTTYTDASGTPAANSPLTTGLTIDAAGPGNLTVTIPEAANGINATEAADGVAVSVSLPSGAAAGDLITVSIDGGTPVTHTVTAAEVSAGSASLTLSAAVLAAAGQGAATITTTYANASGTPAANSPVTTGLTIDTVAPGNLTVTIPEAADGINAAEAADGVAVNVSLPSGAAAGDLITVRIDSGTPVTHTVTAAEVSAGSASLTLSKAAVDAAGQGPAIVITTYTDASGNPAANSPMGTSVTIDTASLGNLTVTIPEAANGINAAEAADGVAVNVSLPSGGAVGDLITVSIDGSAPVTHTVTAAEVSAGSASLTLSKAAVAAAGEGAATVTTTYTNASGNPAANSPVSTSLTIDTEPPIDVTAINIAAIVDDTGTDNHDFITSDSTLIVNGTFDGTLAATERIQISSNGTTWIDITNVTGNTWTYDDTATPHSGTFTYQVRVVDIAGNVGVTHSQQVTVTGGVDITSAVDNVANLDVTSNLVLSAGEAVTAVAGKYIHIVNDGGPGFHGENTVHTQDILVTSSMVTISGNKIIINPGFDLDLANNYHITVDEGAFVGVSSGLASDAITDPTALNFSTVTPGSTAVANAAASQMMQADGSLVAGRLWLDLEGIGTPSSSSSTPLDLSGGNYTGVFKDYDSDGGTPVNDGVGVGNAFPRLNGFGAGDLLYIDDQFNNPAAVNDLAMSCFTQGNGTASVPLIWDVAGTGVPGGLGAKVEIVLDNGLSASDATLEAMRIALGVSTNPVISG